MKKSLTYLVALFIFFVGITEVFAVDIYNNGVVSGYGVTSNPYSCGGVNKGVYNLLDENDYRYYSSICSVDFPCTAESQSENSCVGQHNYSYTETKQCYVTCTNYTGNNIGTNQHNIWNNISSYPVASCEGETIDSSDLQTGMTTLINNNSCSNNSNFYILKEYQHESGSKVVQVLDDLYNCEPQIKIKKECKGFSSGTFKVKVGNEEISLSCGQTSDPIVVPANTAITIEELNNEGYMTQFSSNVSNGTVSIDYGTIETVVITNAVGSAEIIKTNGSNGSPMEGITFTLEKEVNGEWVKATNYNGNVINDMTTNENGLLNFSGLLIGKYRVVEVTNKSGDYVASDPIEFLISRDEVDSNYKNILNIKNNPFKFRILKVDINNNGLENAIFMIQKKGTDNVFETVSEIPVEKGGTDLFLEKNGYYRITEIQSPLGYDILNDSIDVEIENGSVKRLTADSNYVSISEENGVIVLKIINDKSKVKFYKRDSATGNLLSGATFELLTKDGILVKEFTTTEGAFAIELVPGNYILTEKTAPKNYEKLNSNFEFLVKEDGTIEAITNNIAFEVDGMSINIYNVKPTTVPDTGIGLNILFTTLGVALIGGGGYLVYNNVKKRKNIK